MTQEIEEKLVIRWLQKQDYTRCWEAMKKFTQERTPETLDEIWFLEHEPVFTQGQNGSPAHLLDPGDIPVVQTDRGGQVTYHGPGQLMVYTLIDLKRKKMNVREFVSALENAVVRFLEHLGIHAHSKREAPGVYVDEAKICSIGLRIRRGYSYHGMAFNINLDTEPFTRINPCGFKDLRMTQLSLLGGPNTSFSAAEQLIAYLMEALGYTNVQNKMAA